MMLGDDTFFLCGLEVEGLEIRQRGKRLSGRFPYGQMATVRAGGRVRKEQIMPLSFDYAIKDTTREISLLTGHDYQRPLGSRLRGSLEIRNTASAVEFEATLPEPSARPSWMIDTILAVESGLLAGLSPGFRLPPADVIPDAEVFVPEPGNPGVEIRQIHQAVLLEMSIVSRPAYAKTQIETRAAQFRTVEEYRRLI